MYNREEFLDGINIPEYWFNLGLEREADSVEGVAYKFVAYWIAFNALYSCMSNGSREIEENVQIENYIRNTTEGNTIAKAIDFTKDEDGKFNLPELEIFSQGTVCKGPYYKTAETVERKLRAYKTNGGKIYRDEKNYYSLMHGENNITRTVGLMLSIYQVRCNLFHGQKGPATKRNVELVDSSQKILERVLHVVIEQ